VEEEENTSLWGGTATLLYSTFALTGRKISRGERTRFWGDRFLNSKLAPPWWDFCEISANRDKFAGKFRHSYLVLTIGACRSQARNCLTPGNKCSRHLYSLQILLPHHSP